MTIPIEFKNRMKNLLKPEEFDLLVSSYDIPACRGLRVNLLKCPVDYFEKHSPFALRSIPFAPEGFSIGGEVSGRHPWHHAGVFYLQEPSAMSAVTALDPKPGMKILDLCAAPGGKSTQAAARLGGRGLIVCNEIVPSRAKILLSNIERMGVRNAAVTCESPQKLCEKLPGYFDCVLVDAPCSGEGMFRREPAAASEWEIGTPAVCARRQSAILESAQKALSPGGVLVYSTCTFSPEENEGVVDEFLKNHPEFEIETIPARFGRPARPEWVQAQPGVEKARRVFPFDGGEGHFVARLRKTSGARSNVASFPTGMRGPEIGRFEEFFTAQFRCAAYAAPLLAGESVYLIPRDMPNFSALGIRLLRAGVLAGKIKKNRFEPEHALYLAARAEEIRNRADFDLESDELAAYLHGEEIAAPEGVEKGYAAVLAGGFPVGYAKVSDGIMKNHYPKGLRNLQRI